MSDHSNYDRHYKKYGFGEEGLCFEDDLIAYCNPVLERKVTYYDLREKKRFIRYFVKALFPDGSEGEVIELPSLDKLSCFELWQCPDIKDSGKEQRLVIKKLQLEAAMMESEDCIQCHSGLQWYNGHPLYVLGDRVIGKEKLSEMVVIDSMEAYPANSGRKRDDLCQLAKSVINILPGTSEIIFYYALQAVVKPILHEIGINTDYLLAVIGPSGHLKSSLSERICLWLSDEGKQSVSFSSPLRTKRLLDDMDSCSGLNFLVDDFHAYEKTQDIDRQNKRLDDIARHVDDNPDCANIIITGECIQGIFSCIDRAFVINIPRMNAEKLTRLKAGVNMIPDNLMAELAAAFVGCLLSNIASVMEECQKFYQENCIDPNPGNGNATRTYRHCMFLRLTELLYRKYMCGGNAELSCQDALEKAIENQYVFQQKQLQKISAMEQRDYVSDVFYMLSGENKYIEVVVDEGRYTDYSRTCLQKDNTIYITRQALSFGMMEYYQIPIPVNKIVRCLEDAMVLNVGTDSTTKKFKGKRHYSINLLYYRKYMGYKKKQEEID